MEIDLGPKRSYKADINLTPLVDVMLVLLIIMMLIAPLLRQGVPLALPEANNTGEKPDTQNQTVVAIDSHSNFYVNLIPVTAGDLVPRVQRALEDKKEKLVYVKGDREARYSAIMDAMDALHKAHIEDIALITDPKQNRDTQARGMESSVPVEHANAIDTDRGEFNEAIRSRQARARLRIGFPGHYRRHGEGSLPGLVGRLTAPRLRPPIPVRRATRSDPIAVAVTLLFQPARRAQQ